MMITRFSSSVVDLLREAGWEDGRKTRATNDVVSDSSIFPAAETILKEFNGLHVGKCGPGIDCATSDVEFDPQLTVHLADELRNFELQLGTKLFALGEVHLGHGFLVVDECGKIYLMNDELLPFAPSIEMALEKLLLGRKSLGEERASEL